MHYTAMHIILFRSIMYYTRPRYLTLGTSWIYRPRLSSPIFGVALRIILAQIYIQLILIFESDISGTIYISGEGSWTSIAYRAASSDTYSCKYGQQP